MLKNLGAHTLGGDLSAEDQERAKALIIALEEKIEAQVSLRRLAPAVVRPMMSGSMLVGKWNDSLFVGYQLHLGMPTVVFTVLKASTKPTVNTFITFLQQHLGFNDACAIVVEERALNALQKAEREAALEQMAAQIISHEVAVFERRNQIAEQQVFSPIFGPNLYPVQQNLVFVLMPFRSDLTQIYNAIIKPTIESDFGLVCRRADDVSSNKAVIQDIWKSICEARLVVADITDFYANVMYELGITHTIGKETILVYQKPHDTKTVAFPFDLAHIRRIEYKNDVLGADQLRNDLKKTVRACLDIKISADAKTFGV